MQIPLSIGDQWGEATPLSLSLAFSLSHSVSLPPPLLSVLLLPLSLATNVRCVNWRLQLVCACLLLESCSFFEEAKGTHSLQVLLHLISVGWESATGWLWLWGGSVSMCAVLYVYLCISLALPCLPVNPVSESHFAKLPMSPRGWSSPKSNTEGGTAEHNLLFF